MRPLRLALSHFGPYGAGQVVDFADLGPHRLFLIAGPTGAGKTSLLDAMCFALFGESSGSERAASDLRARHAPPDEPTEVTFEFEQAGRRYRIARSPAWERPKKRGEGTTSERMRVSLLEPGRDDPPVERDDEVARRVAGILGLTAAEFRQTVLLPQGRFRELLVAPPEARQGILRTLFRSALYRRVQDALRVEANAAKRGLDLARERRAGVLRRAGAETLQGANDLRPGKVTIRDAARAAEAAARATDEAVRGAVEAGRRDAALLLEAEGATLALEEAEARRHATAADRARLEAARRADRLGGTIAEADAAARTALAARRAASEAGGARDAAATRDATARAALAGGAKREQEAAEASAEAARLSDLAGEVAGLEVAEAEAERAAAAAARAAGVHERAERAVGEARVRVEETERSRAAVAAEAAQAERHRLERDAAASWLAALDEAARARDALAKATAEDDRARESLARSEARADGARQARAEAQRRVLADQAAHLAARLVPGEPCPVCGAPEHPAPARRAEGPPQDLDALVAEEDAAMGALTPARRKAERTGAARAEAAGRLQALIPPETTDRGVLSAALAGAAAALEAAENAAGRLPRMVATAAEAVATREAAEARIGAARNEGEEAARTAVARAATRDALRARLPDGTPDAAALRARALEREATARRVLDVLRAAGEEAARAAEALTGATEVAARAEAEAGRTESSAAALAAGLGDAARAAGFGGPEEARAARMAGGEQDTLSAAIERFEADLAARRDRAAKAAAASEGVAAPDLPALEDAARDAAAALTGAVRDAALRARELDEFDALLAEIASAEEGLRDAEAALDLRRDLADLATGAGTGLDFEGYVLSGLLDESLAAANRRLAGMLGGRFTLRRREEPGRRRRAGLDIEVLDGWNAEARAAATLSGGEGFCASLALALGLSETVAAHAGARQLDALFVDEGFGTLDAEALDTAIGVLEGLQAGERLVGVISHVAEMRERLPARLEVTPGRGGSAARFVMG